MIADIFKLFAIE